LAGTVNRVSEQSGRYSNGELYQLPRSWDAVDEDLLKVAMDRTLRALSIVEGDPKSVEHRLTTYYEPEGGYAGNLFSSAEPNEEFRIAPSDLWAVSTLSMKIPPLTGRKLIADGLVRTEVIRHLRRISPVITIAELDPVTLSAMWDLQDRLRSVVSTDDKTANRWVFAAKMCARKRPRLFPVRDSLVCSYLSGGKSLGKGPGKLGTFTRDIQVFAYLMTSDQTTMALDAVRQKMTSTSVAAEVDWSDLRVLDIALWTAAKLGVPSV
jgi:hypothetical protein